jgi:alpha,alpha-trehalose phosphorylase
VNNSKSWKLEQNDFSREKAAFWETLLTVGNGFIGMRGTPEEGGGHGSVQGTYLNGFYETAPIVYGEKFRGFAEMKQTMLNIADARVIRLIVDGEVMTAGNGRVLEENRSLDMRRGILERRLVWRSSTGREVEVRSIRLAHQVRRALAMIEYTVTPLNFAGELVIQSGIDSGIRQSEHAEEDPRLGTRFAGEVLVTSEPVTIRDGRGAALTQRTVASGLTMACGFTDRLSCPGDSTSWHSGGIAGLAHHVSPKKGESVTLHKTMAYAAGPGLGAGLPVEEGRKIEPASLCARLIQEVAEDLTEANQAGFDILLDEHISYLEDFWKDSDIIIDGDDQLQRGIRFNLLHLLQSTGRGGRTNIAAKGLTGLGYEGHTFWDTETYILPVFLFTRPDIARALLEYRYNTLDAARDHAREMGHPKGALYPWRTINGRECSANFATGSAQYHINADIAFAVKRYVDSTDDKSFLAEFGAEILFETARVWFDTGSFSASKGGRFCINGVTGPDEYHILVDNNAYTNLMARENLRFAAEAVDRLRRDDPEALKDIQKRIALDDQEPGQWATAADAMYIPYDERIGVIPQDEGFFWTGYLGLRTHTEEPLPAAASLSSPHRHPISGLQTGRSSPGPFSSSRHL